MRAANPTLNVFEKPQTWADLDARERSLKTMTMTGTVQAASVLLGICVALAYVTWIFVPQQFVFAAAIGSAVLGLVFTLVICFKPKMAPVLSIPAAACEGVFVGALSMWYAAFVGALSTDGSNMKILAAAGSGIVIQAVLLTFGIFAAMLIAYSSRMIRATPALVKGIMAATVGVLVMMVGWFFLRMFTPVPSILEMGWVGVGISAVIVVIAAFNLIIDFDVIETGVKNQAPKYMEWYGAFGLMITLVWLYVSILRLLAVLAATRD